METLQVMFYFLLLSIRWIPRILCILFAVFITLFSFDVFGHDTGFWKSVTGFIIHNIPTILIIAILILSWNRSWIGGVCYICLGFIYIYAMPGNNKSPLIFVPLFTIGALFLIDWFLRSYIKNAQEAYWGDN